MQIRTKKGGGGMENNMGGGVCQRELLTNLENHLQRTAVSTACLLNTSYNTYKEWKGNRRKMTGPTIRLIEYLFVCAGTKQGKIFGI